MLVQVYVSKFLGFSRFTWGPVVFAYGHKGTDTTGVSTKGVVRALIRF